MKKLFIAAVITLANIAPVAADHTYSICSIYHTPYCQPWLTQSNSPLPDTIPKPLNGNCPRGWTAAGSFCLRSRR